MSVLGTGKSHHQIPVSDQELGCQPARGPAGPME